MTLMWSCMFRSLFGVKEMCKIVLKIIFTIIILLLVLLLKLFLLLNKQICNLYVTNNEIHLYACSVAGDLRLWKRWDGWSQSDPLCWFGLGKRETSERRQYGKHLPYFEVLIACMWCITILNVGQRTWMNLSVAISVEAPVCWYRSSSSEGCEFVSLSDRQFK